MLFICTKISEYKHFRELFCKENPDTKLLDLSRVPSCKLADESDSIISHHSKSSIFLGYLEPGWMLDPADQTRLRKLFRKFPVALVTNFVESIPFSWKNEINTLYTDESSYKDGASNSVNNGSVIQKQSPT
jgi:hypothetical protein